MSKAALKNDCSVFFSNIPYTTSPGYIRKIFSTVGPVQHVELYTGRTGESIGAGLVFFQDFAAAAQSVTQMDQADVDGRQMSVKLNSRADADPDARVFFNGVPFSTTKGFLQAKFEAYGEITQFDLWRKMGVGSSLGKGTCEFSTPKEAHAACAALNGIVVDGREMTVQMDDRPEDNEIRAGPSKGGGKGGYSKGGKGGKETWVDSPKGKGGKSKGKSKGKWEAEGTRIFWSNAATDTNEGFLRAKFEKVGTIVDFDFWRREDGASLGRGTCEFDHYLGAWRAVERLHETEIDGQTILIKMDQRRGA